MIGSRWIPYLPKKVVGLIVPMTNRRIKRQSQRRLARVFGPEARQMEAVAELGEK
jgi:hypothetical protein